MEVNNLESFGDLEAELNSAKNNLASINENIKKIVGRNFKEIRNKQKSSQGNKKHDNAAHDSGVADLKRPRKRSCDDSPSRKRLSTPRLNSRVIRELPSRQEIMAAQCSDSQSRDRNRRIFGSLLGTLQKFCQEESRLKPKEDKKAQIEKKLEEQEMQERENDRKLRETLFVDRKKNQLIVKHLEMKINRVKDFQSWEAATLNLQHHIKTKHTPPIYFKPKVLSKKTEKLLQENQASLNEEIKSRRVSLQKELEALERKLREHEVENNSSDPERTNERYNT